MRRQADLSGSSAIDRAAYDTDTLELNVTFTSGQTYTFHNVPLEIFDGLESAPSPGRYYHQMIKGQYA
jgi:KTSC domain